MRRPQRRVARRHLGRAGLAVPLGAAIAALLASSGPAHAGTGYGQLIVNPGTAAPGQSVSVLGTCPNNGTGLRGVYSPAFVGGSASVTQSSINFSGSATIAPGASGTYTVTADCGSGSPSVNITVSGGAVTSSTPPVATTQPGMPVSSPSAVRTSAAPVMSQPAMSPAGGGDMPAPAKSTAPMQGGGMGASPAKTTGMTMPTPTAAAGTQQAMPATPGMTTAGNGPVTSTGIVRVGLAGSSRSAMTTAGAAAIALAAALAGGAGFLFMRRRRRDNSGSHS